MSNLKNFLINFFKKNLLVICTFLLVGVFFAASVNTSSDTYFFMSVGRQAWQQKQVPNYDNFIYGPEDKTLKSVEWLSGFIYFIFFSAFQASGLVILRIALALLTLYFIYKTFKLFATNQLAIISFVLFASYILASRTDDRPETFSYLFLSIINYSGLHYLFKNKISPALYLLPAIFIIWPSTHPFAVIGIIIFSFFAALTVKEKLINKITRKDLSKFLIIYLLSQIAAFIQYRKVFIFLQASNLSSKYVEFQSLKERVFFTEGLDFLNQIPIEIYAYLLFALTYFILLVIFLKKNGKVIEIYASRQIFYAALLALPLKFYRLIPLTLILATPNLFYLLKSVSPKNNKLLRFMAIGFLAVMTMLITGSIFNRNIIGSRRMFQIITVNTDKNTQLTSVLNRSWSKTFPEQAPSIISKYLNTKRLFTAANWNNYFIWYLPDIKTFADAQSYNRQDKDLKDEQIITSGGTGWEQLLLFYNIDTIVKDQRIVSPFVYTPISNLANWKLVYVNDTFSIYARDDAIKSLPVDLSALQPDLQTDLKYKKEDETKAIGQLKSLLKFDNKNGFAREQLIIYNITIKNDLGVARKLAEESRLLIPGDPVYSFDLAYISALENNCTSALGFQKETMLKSYNHPVYRQLTDFISQKCNR